MQRYMSRTDLEQQVRQLKQDRREMAETVVLLSDEIPTHRLSALKLARIRKARNFYLKPLRKKKLQEAPKCSPR